MSKKLLIRRSICVVILSPLGPIGATGDNFTDLRNIDNTSDNQDIVLYEDTTIEDTNTTQTDQLVVLPEEDNSQQIREPDIDKILPQEEISVSVNELPLNDFTTISSGSSTNPGNIISSGSTTTGIITTISSGTSIGTSTLTGVVSTGTIIDASLSGEPIRGDEDTEDGIQEGDSKENIFEEQLQKVRKKNEGLCKKSTIHCIEKVLDDNQGIEVTIIEDDESGSYYDESTGTLYEYDKKPIIEYPQETSQLIGSGTATPTLASGSILTGSLDIGSGSSSVLSTGSTVPGTTISSGGNIPSTTPTLLGSGTNNTSYIPESNGTGEVALLSEEKNDSPRRFVIDTKKILTTTTSKSISALRSSSNTQEKSKSTKISVGFDKDTRVDSIYGEVLSFDDIEVLIPQENTLPQGSLSSLLIGAPNDHLLFSHPTQIILPVDSIEDGTEVELSVLHYGQDKYNRSGISVDPNTQCDTEGNATLPSRTTIIENGTVTFYTCSASTFTVTYVGGATFDNFVDNSSLLKTITVGAGGAITDLNVLVDFQPIDSEDPTAFGTTNAFSNEVSMTLESPTGTVISLLDAGTYTNNGAANRAAVTFDDAAGSAPTNLPVDGTFNSSDLLSSFNAEDPIGDWIFTISDNANQDGVILFEVSLELTDASTCGNSTLEGAEGCDDGGTAPGDGCDVDCLIEDTFACNTSGLGAEDDLGCTSGVCDQTELTPTCEAANSCGNGLRETGEECDDGNTTAGDGCSATCTIQYCSNGTIDTASSFDTIFDEDFESDNGTTQTSGTEIITALTHTVTYENDGANGRVQYGTNAQLANGGAGAVSIDVAPTGTFVTNQLIFESDLSAYDGATDIELSFDWTDHGDEDQPEDIVEIRGSDNDSRIQVYDFNANTQANGTYRTITIDIDDELTNNSQTPTDTFQIRFGQNDNFSINNNNANDGLSLDNISVTATRPGPLVDELCDDTNATAGDGCSATCTIESGFTCVGEPSVCSSCGNGTIEGTDTCDDGNTTPGDGCSDTCQIEEDYTCIGAPSVCSFCASNDVIKGTVVSSVGSIAQTISFSDFTSHTYTSTPIVLMTPVTDTNTNNYSLPVISSLSTTSVTISSCVDAGDSTCDTTLNDDDFALFVIDTDAASCSDDIEAGTTTIATNGSDTAFTFTNAFTNTPYVFTTPQTSSQGANIAAHAWVDDGSLSINGGDFVGCVHQAPGDGTSIDNCTPGQPNETLGRLAVDPTLFSYSGFQLGTQGISNSNWTAINFTPSYTESPAIMVTQNSDNGGQDPQYARARDVTTSDADIRYCEADAGGVCNSHTSETVRRFSLDITTCGNGEITGSETCDDGNTDNGDGCSSTCSIESGYSCSGEPSSCTLLGGCGDGVVDIGEECDDGNTASLDGCSDICELENPLLCGNGDINPGETCDDNNGIDSDGCSSTCQVESGFICPDNSLCGNNTIDTGEQCDDGNTTDGDGCSQYCIDEFNFNLVTFTGESLVPDTAPGGGLDFPIWTFDPSGYEATVEVGANPYASVLYAPFNFWNLAAPRAIELAFQGASDDDFIGYVFGFQPGDRSNPDADFILVKRKDVDQTFNFNDDPIGGGVAQAGLSVTRVQGVVSYDELRQSIDSPNTTGSVTELARGTNYGNIGYTQDLYDTSVFYNTGQIDVYVDGALDISLTGSFDDGRFGIYILAQAGNTFALGRPHPYALGGGCYAECGDSVVVGDETCDDGNTINGDGCSEFCAVEAPDECVLGTDTCNINATCFNSYDGFDCICNAGFNGDGFTCVGTGNTAPSDITLSGNSLVENNSLNQLIGSLTTTDSDLADSHSYSFGCAVPLADEDFFTLSGSQLLAGTGFNFEIPFDTNTDNDYEVCILTDDGNGGTYEETFTLSLLDEYEEVCIYVGSGVVYNPIPVSADGNIIATQTLTGRFALEDLNGSNTGYYTTLQIGGFNGALGNFMPATIAEIRNTAPIAVISGSANANVQLDAALTSFIPFDSPITYLSRATGINNGITGYYETSPTLRLTIPEYQAVDQYSATITYTLYEN